MVSISFKRSCDSTIYCQTYFSTLTFVALSRIRLSLRKPNIHIKAQVIGFVHCLPTGLVSKQSSFNQNFQSMFPIKVGASVNEWKNDPKIIPLLRAPMTNLGYRALVKRIYAFGCLLPVTVLRMLRVNCFWFDSSAGSIVRLSDSVGV